MTNQRKVWGAERRLHGREQMEAPRALSDFIQEKSRMFMPRFLELVLLERIEEGLEILPSHRSKM